MPKIVDHDARRRDLAEACFRILAERGYASASMRQLAAEAGVSTGTLYHYFPTKQAILVHVFDIRMARDQDRLEQLLAGNLPVADRLRTVVRYAEAQEADLSALLRLALELVRHEPEPDSRAVVADAVRRYRASLGAVLGVADEGQVSLLFSLLVGVLAHGLIEVRPAAEREALDALLEIVAG